MDSKGGQMRRPTRTTVSGLPKGGNAAYRNDDCFSSTVQTKQAGDGVPRKELHNFLDKLSQGDWQGFLN